MLLRQSLPTTIRFAAWAIALPMALPHQPRRRVRADPDGTAGSLPGLAGTDVILPRAFQAGVGTEILTGSTDATPETHDIEATTTGNKIAA
jgi:hypothetical protein